MIFARLDEGRGWRGFNAGAGFFIFCLFMLCPVAPEHWTEMYSFFGRIILVAFMALFFYHYRPGGRFEVNLVLLYKLVDGELVCNIQFSNIGIEECVLWIYFLQFLYLVA